MIHETNKSADLIFFFTEQNCLDTFDQIFPAEESS